MNRQTRIVLIVVGGIALFLLSLGTGVLVWWLTSRPPAAQHASSPSLNVSSPARTSEQAPLDLSPFINAELDRGWVPGLPPESNLAAMPRGTQEMAGVMFNIVGPVQLQGSSWRNNPWSFPKKAEGIRVERTCDKFHLLHATRGAFPANGTVAARLVIHYEDGTDEALQIRAGEHLLNWIAAPEKVPTDTNTVLAWTGDNSVSVQRGEKIRIWRTTFGNPHVDKKVVSLDYASALASCGPLLLGVTVE